MTVFWLPWEGGAGPRPNTQMKTSASVTPDGLTAVDPADLLEILKGFPPLEPFHLLLFEQAKTTGTPRVRHCGFAGDPPPCDHFCNATREEALQGAISTSEPVVFSCPLGLLHFAISFELAGPLPCCLMAGGVREKSAGGASPAASAVSREWREEMEARPRMTRPAVEEVATQVQRLLPTLLSRNLHAVTLEKIVRRTRAVAGIAQQFDTAATMETIAAQLCETAVVLFDVPRAVLVTSSLDGRYIRVQGEMGMPTDTEGRVLGRVGEILRDFSTGRRLRREEVEELFPGLDAQATGLPLTSSKEAVGLLILFGAELSLRDLMLLELLTGRAAAKLLSLRREAELIRESSASHRLLSMISALALIDTREELYLQIVEMAADLLQASSGSLMLLDEAGESLRIEAAKGMSLPLARSMNVRLGTGIAGKVAKSGFPLLVNDIERDARVAIANRPRFRTKSFISIPLRPKGAVIGVLNLADKEDQGSFNEADLNQLTSFVAHASVMIERIMALERASRLEELSITDPLTGLYNRRFLEKRLEEELNRSCRQNLSFTLLMVDLDSFKTYNDLCGHVAGDNALWRVAKLLQASAREMDVVTRYGGEEFCLILPGTSKKESLFVAERIRRTIEKEPFPQEARLPLKHLTASLGIASYPEDAGTANSLIHAADLALYQAKNEGRNRLVIYSPELRSTPEPRPDPLPNNHCG